MNYQWLATCPKGIESLLVEELVSLGAINHKETVAGVSFEADLNTAYEICLWSRLANRVLMQLKACRADSADQLYQDVKSIPWDEHMAISSFFRVDFNGTNKAIKNSHFGALKIKDAIVDYMKEKFDGERPSVDKDKPGIRINVFLKYGMAQVSLDFSGDSLHRRGYRKTQGLAPLKENLASALLYRMGWLDIYKQKGGFLDPLCGSGTLLIEAAYIALDRAPGLTRTKFGFDEWLGHRPELWDDCLLKAKKRYQLGLENHHLNIIGFDASQKAIDAARQNIQRSGLGKWIKIEKRELSELTCPKPLQNNRGLLLTNPPYGERISEVPALLHLYKHLGRHIKSQFLDWKVGVLTSNPDLGKQLGIRAKKMYKFYNGALESRLLTFDVQPEWFMKHQVEESNHEGNISQHLDAQAEMFANRVKKNIRLLSKWIKKEEIECYRIYDADMPEYNVAVDVYKDWLHVQEYRPPASVSEEKAQSRLMKIVQALSFVYECPLDKIILKHREKQKGTKQYEKLGAQRSELEVREGQAMFIVNLNDYLDTGLFLDHRPIRLQIHRLAENKRFLNLYSYTSTASVHAALGGAVSTTSVDMSATYCEWSRKNIALNGLSDDKHQVIQADCFKWLQDNHQMFDLIFMDPPTFSNSKKMEQTLDIQRDHVELIHLAMKHLEQNGELIFSNNYRRFQLDKHQLEQYDIEDITRYSIPKDFERNTKIHQCWKIRWKKDTGR